ncbi:hypothetical protein [Caballeronia sp. AZ10_KS36]|uniref:hypothetical protein n=1 Tax=Caballeronia sp. AZ10_KS36 TaxID=2921757 RepID=UPI0020289818|nr:hypothetical protein [Caballeronia sp. AZ10_KS36]
MDALISTTSNSSSISTIELLEMVNEARRDFGESEVRRNDFTARCKDELDGEYYESFVVSNPRGPASEALRISRDQCMYVLMRESKSVRRKVTAKLNEKSQAVTPLTSAELLLQMAQLNVEHERRLKQTEQAVARVEQRIEDLTETRAFTSCPSNAEPITHIRRRIGEEFGLSARIVDEVLRQSPIAPKPAGEVKNNHEDANGSTYTVWWKKDVTAVFRRFVGECQQITPAQFTHPFIDFRFKITPRESGENRSGAGDSCNLDIFH